MAAFRWWVNMMLLIEAQPAGIQTLKDGEHESRGFPVESVSGETESVESP